METKTCSRCKLILGFDRFHACSQARDGLKSACKACVSEAAARARSFRTEEKTARLRLSEKRYREAHPDRTRASRKKWYDKNADKARADNKEYNRQRRLREPDFERWAKLWHLYRLRREDFESMLASQGGACAGCPERAGRWHVDHDHACCPGVRSCGSCVRGILCHYCNMTLGDAQDSPSRLRSLATYLETREQKT